MSVEVDGCILLLGLCPEIALLAINIAFGGGGANIFESPSGSLRLFVLNSSQRWHYGPWHIVPAKQHCVLTMVTHRLHMWHFWLT